MREDDSAFHSRHGAAASPATRRDESQFAQERREPFGASQHGDDHEVTLYTNAYADFDADSEHTRCASINALVERLILHDDRPIENLPQMVSPELKLIGLCVALRIKQRVNGAAVASFYYTGLVSTVSATAVTLMHVNRYTHADFKAYTAREERIVKNGTAGNSAEPSRGVQIERHAWLPAQGYTADGAVGVAEDGGLANSQDPAALLLLSASGSLAPATALTRPSDLWAAEAAEKRHDGAVSSPTTRSRHFRAFDGSVGPIPYVTFLRKSINDVEFGRDPRSAFYALFQDPARAITDMQYLRMFVRRYLVHTSEHNNPRQVPVYAFLAVRLGWPTLDRELVNQLVREELPALLKADGAVAKAKKQGRIDMAHRVQEVQQYHSPRGLFSQTGLLYLTRIPQTTVATALLTLLCTVAFAIYLGTMRGVFLDSLAVSFLQQFMSIFVASIVIFAVAGIAVILHGVVMHIPLLDNAPRLAARVAFVLGALACGAVMMAKVLVKLSNVAIFEVLVNQQCSQLCSFFRHHSCTGFSVPGDSDSGARLTCLFCPSMPATTTSCDAALWSQVQVALVPLLVLAGVNLLAFLLSFYLLMKVFVFVDSVMGRLV